MKNDVICAGEDGNVNFSPRYVMLKVTNRCNSCCKYCNHAADKGNLEVKEDIPTGQLVDLIHQAARLGVKAVSISGGEPLLRSDIGQLVKEMVKQCIVPVLLTNGLLLNEFAQSLYDAGLRYFIVSIDSLKKEFYELQRGAMFETLVKGLAEIKTLKQKDNNVKIHVTSVVTRYNLEEIPQMVKTLSADAIAVQFSPYHHFNPNAEDCFSVEDYTALDQVVDELVAMKKEGFLIANSETFLRHFQVFFKEKKHVPDGYHCAAGYVSVYVDSHMNILPCWSGVFQPIGNLVTDSLKDIWYGERYAAYRKRMYQCGCDGCWFLCTGELTTIINEEDELF